jgi:hypothetical protein
MSTKSKLFLNAIPSDWFHFQTVERRAKKYVRTKAYFYVIRVVFDVFARDVALFFFSDLKIFIPTNLVRTFFLFLVQAFFLK